MRIAIASEENKGIEGVVSYHFGRCPYYVFADVENGKIVNVITKKNPFHGEHQRGAVPQFIADESANIIIAGGMGHRAIDRFTQLGIQPATGVSGKIKDILNDYLAGKIESAEPCGEGVK